MKLWGGRFETGPSEVFEQFSGSLHFDGKLIFADVEGSQAFARALERAGILTVTECTQIVEAFGNIAQQALAPDYLRGASDEDVHTFVIRQLQGKSTPEGAATNKYRSTFVCTCGRARKQFWSN
jgi:argininosuccinate lyase